MAIENEVKKKEIYNNKNQKTSGGIMTKDRLMTTYLKNHLIESISIRTVLT